MSFSSSSFSSGSFSTAVVEFVKKTVAVAVKLLKKLLTSRLRGRSVTVKLPVKTVTVRSEE